VVCGPGDELTVRFDAAGLPGLPAGWRRSFVLRTWGYCKDTSPTTATGGRVGPPPFRGVPNYPDFGPGEPPAADAATWHTRLADRLLDHLAGPLDVPAAPLEHRLRLAQERPAEVVVDRPVVRVHAEDRPEHVLGLGEPADLRQRDAELGQRRLVGVGPGQVLEEDQRLAEPALGLEVLGLPQPPH